MRCFIAIWPSAEARDRIAEFQREFREQIRGCEIRWTAPEQIHLTLSFLGNLAVSRLEELKQHLQNAARGARPFDLVAEGLGVFPNARRPRVIWIGLRENTDALRAVQGRVEQATASFFKVEEREFHPHLTLGRIDPESRTGGLLADKLQANQVRAFGMWTVTGFDLMQSELTPAGARYTRLAAFELARAS
ncbi:MAG TPA: RNA 2',3'-cyclic phosphodiesterase [Verrucomicrobiae bacterium]|nr:RNA 2',3'-cyclic phosphodiesterase [Verrucomicrobiae bacterium]